MEEDSLGLYADRNGVMCCDSGRRGCAGEVCCVVSGVQGELLAVEARQAAGRAWSHVCVQEGAAVASFECLKPGQEGTCQTRAFVELPMMSVELFHVPFHTLQRRVNAAYTSIHQHTPARDDHDL